MRVIQAWVGFFGHPGSQQAVRWLTTTTHRATPWPLSDRAYQSLGVDLGEPTALTPARAMAGRRSPVSISRMSRAGNPQPSCSPRTRPGRSPPRSPSCRRCCGEHDARHPRTRAAIQAQLCCVRRPVPVHPSSHVCPVRPSSRQRVGDGFTRSSTMASASWRNALMAACGCSRARVTTSQAAFRRSSRR